MPGGRTRGYVFRKFDRDEIVNEENALYGRGFCPLEAFDFFELGVGTVEVNARLGQPLARIQRFSRVEARASDRTGKMA